MATDPKFSEGTLPSQSRLTWLHISPIPWDGFRPGS
jgi:hypothetical protein